MIREPIVITIALLLCLPAYAPAESGTSHYESIKPSELTPEMIGKRCTVFVHGENYNKEEPQVHSDNEATYRGVLLSISDTSISISLVGENSATEGDKRTVSIERARIRKLIVKTEQGAALNGP